MKILIFTLAVLALFQTPKAAAQPKAYFETPRIFSTMKLSVDGNSFAASAFPSKKMTQAFSSNPEALDFATKYRTNQNWATSIGIISVTSAVGYLIYSVSDDEITNFNNVLLNYIIILGVGGFISSIFQFKAKQRLIQSINSYNGVGTVGVKLSPKLELGPATKGFGLALRF